jgi:hypothetical protein
VEPEGQLVKFRLLDEADRRFTYTVTASSTAGDYSFSGVLKNEDLVGVTIGGDTRVRIVAPVFSDREGL